MLLLMLMLMAVAVALVYRLNQTPANKEYATQTISLPAGAEIISAVAQDGVVTITYKADGQTIIRLINGEDGALIQDIMISN
jgi:cytochrome oxidase Cu insertion factor (SCO1/SenC/PrrC family)